MSAPQTLGLIVEGKGDAGAIQVLIPKILKELKPGLYLNLLRPHRVKRNLIVKEDEFRRNIEAVSRNVKESRRILVLLDADDDLPCQLGPMLQGWARKHHSHIKVEVALAQRTFEAWFMASAVSLRGKCGLPEELEAPADPDAVSSPKGWVKDQKKTQGQGYGPSVDQAKLTEYLSVNEARRSKSFDKLCIKLGRLFDFPVPPMQHG